MLENELKPKDLVIGIPYVASIQDVYSSYIIYEVMGTEKNEIIVHPNGHPTLLVWAPRSEVGNYYTLPCRYIRSICKQFNLAPPIIPNVKFNQYAILHIKLDSIKKING